MARKSSPLRKLLSPGRILIPIGIGVAAAAWLLINNFDKDAFLLVKWTWYSTFWLLMALLMMVVRDLAYMIRIKILTDNQFSWRQAFDVIMLWEFASSITPSVVGGSAVALFIINKEGINLGKSTSIVMVTALLDEIFYLTMVPVILLMAGAANLFPVAMERTVFGIKLSTEGIFWAGYIFIFILTSVILLAVFFKPHGFKRVLVKIFQLPFLKKWKERAAETGDEIIISSKELKNKPFMFWLKAVVTTYFSWTARFWVVNFLILSFTTIHTSFGNHLMIYARQLIMWVIMLISPTPGSSGVAEFAFSGFLGDFIVPIGIAGSLALIWRLISYYPYLFIGAVILPGWIKRVYIKRKLITFKST